MLHPVVSKSKDTTANTPPHLARWPGALEHVDDFTKTVRKGEAVVVSEMQMQDANFLVDTKDGVVLSILKCTKGWKWHVV